MNQKTSIYRIILIVFISFAMNTKSQGQQYLWTKTFGSPDSDTSYFSTTDNNGNTYVTGFFTGNVDFDGTGAFTGSTSSSTDKDIFIIKYNPSGDVLWVRTMGGTDTDKGASIAIDNAGDIYITGDFRSHDVNFGGTATDIDALGEEDIFLLKLDANGNFIWFKHYGSPAKDAGISLHFDSSNNLLLTGFFARTVQFDPTIPSSALTSAGFIDALVLKLNTNGDYIWAKSFAGAEYVKGLFITTDSENSVYVTGYYFGTADFNPSPSVENNHTSNGARDFYVTKLDVDGNYVWSGSIGGAEDDRALSIAVDNADNLYFVGFFADVADFDMGTGTQIRTSNGDSDAFIFKIDNSGNYIWMKQIGSVGPDFANEIKFDRDMNLLITGSFSSTVDFDPGLGTENFTSTGPNSDIFVLKMNGGGNYIWNITMGDHGTDEAYALSIDFANNIYVSGTFRGNVDFDFSPTTDVISSNGGNDVFLTKLHDNTASAKNLEKDNSISIFPNPINTMVQIASSKGIIDSVTVKDLNGRIVRQQIVNDKQTQIDLSKEANGIYFIEVKTENNIFISKILKE